PRRRAQLRHDLAGGARRGPDVGRRHAERGRERRHPAVAVGAACCAWQNRIKKRGPSDGSTRAGTTAGDLAPTLRGAAVLLAAPLRAAPGGGAVRERVGLEAVVDLARHARAGVALDRAEVVLLARRDERDRVAGGLGAARPPDPVDVVLRDVRRVV